MQQIPSTINPHRYAVIMCGGIGSRFWPSSRTARPKQFLDFFGTGTTLLQMTFERVCHLVDPANVIIVTNAMYASLVKEQLPQVKDHNILLEPARRNTAPCVAWAAAHIMALDKEASIIVTPSDHLITRENEFDLSVARGFEFVEDNDAILTLGISPTRPETGYGYIQVGPKVDGNINKVKTFTEKPDIDMAKVFLSTGEFFWNSGIFMWRASTILKAFAEHAPAICAVFDKGRDKMGTTAEKSFIESNFTSCPSISIDYAVMEKARNVYVETVNFGWSDLGTWSALYDNSPKNRDANVTQNCNILSYDSTGNIFAVEGDKLIAVRGLHNYIVADSKDVLLICPKADEQRIKNMVNDARMAFGDKYQ